jgi:hypothetical protein
MVFVMAGCANEFVLLQREGLTVKILGLDSGAQVIILQGLSTYAALASAYCFANPVLRSQTVQSHRDILSSLESKDQDVSKLIKQAADTLTRRAQRDQPLARRNNLWGVVLLVASFLLFTGAVTLQVFTDPSFVSCPANTTPQNATTTD